MRFTKTFAIAAVSFVAAALPAMAQTSSSTTTTSTQSPSASESGTPASTTSTATLSVGQPVKDKTGLVIGQIADLKPGAAGQTATVKMGEQSFSIGAESFVVQNGAAVINATQAELKQMIASAAKPG